MSQTPVASGSILRNRLGDIAHVSPGHRLHRGRDGGSNHGPGRSRKSLISGAISEVYMSRPPNPSKNLVVLKTMFDLLLAFPPPPTEVLGEGRTAISL